MTSTPPGLALVEPSTYAHSVADHRGWLAARLETEQVLCHVEESPRADQAVPRMLEDLAAHLDDQGGGRRSGG